MRQSGNFSLYKSFGLTTVWLLSGPNIGAVSDFCTYQSVEAFEMQYFCSFGKSRLYLNHLRVSQTLTIGRCTPYQEYRPISHLLKKFIAKTTPAPLDSWFSKALAPTEFLSSHLLSCQSVLFSLPSGVFHSSSSPFFLTFSCCCCCCCSEDLLVVKTFQFLHPRMPL